MRRLDGLSVAVGLVAGIAVASTASMLGYSSSQRSPSAHHFAPAARPDDARRPVLAQCIVAALAALPVSGGVIHAHHADYRSAAWNEELRLAPLGIGDGEAPCVFLDVGGHARAVDTQLFLRAHPRCTFHVFEPIPQYVASLRRTFAGRPNVRVHGFGLGSSGRVLHLSRSALRGQATYVMSGGSDTAGGNDTIRAPVEDSAVLLRTIGDARATAVLHVNCEGCEWELFPRLAELGALRHFAVVQYSLHLYGSASVRDRLATLCGWEQELRATHARDRRSVHFGWERWTRRSGESAGRDVSQSTAGDQPS